MKFIPLPNGPGYVVAATKTFLLVLLLDDIFLFAIAIDQ